MLWKHRFWGVGGSRGRQRERSGESSEERRSNVYSEVMFTRCLKTCAGPGPELFLVILPLKLKADALKKNR